MWFISLIGWAFFRRIGLIERKVRQNPQETHENRNPRSLNYKNKGLDWHHLSEVRSTYRKKENLFGFILATLPEFSYVLKEL